MTTYRKGKDMSDQNIKEARSHLRERVQALVLDAMHRHGWSQAELARKANMPRNCISLYARGKSIPSSEYATRLAKVLAVTPGELTGITQADEKAPHAEWIDIRNTENGYYLLSFQKELTASQLTQFLELIDKIDQRKGAT